MIVDYNYYIDVFKGTASAFDTSSSFEAAERKAETKLNYLTGGRLKRMTEYPDTVKDALCALCEAIHDVDSIKAAISDNNGNVVSSVSSLGVSVSYGSEATDLKKAAVSVNAENTYMRKVVEEYLAGSGLLYVGF